MQLGTTAACNRLVVKWHPVVFTLFVILLAVLLIAFEVRKLVGYQETGGILTSSPP